MKQYLDLLDRIMKEGTDVPTGAYLPSENRQPFARTILGAQFRHDLADGFPAVTTKKLYFESVVKEMLWFLRGETNVKTLGCKIWDAWAGTNGHPAGECGRIYGYNWRRWQYVEDARPWDDDPATSQALGYIEEWDQVDRVVTDLKAVRNDPFNRARRRIILSSWNPPFVDDAGLPACHTLAQWLPTNDTLNCHCFWRSIDAPVGFPFNVAQYAFLTHLLCEITGFTPGTLVASITDLHIYDNQHDLVVEQLSREPYPHPTLTIHPDVQTIASELSVAQAWRLRPDMFGLTGYKCHPALRCEVAV